MGVCSFKKIGLKCLKKLLKETWRFVKNHFHYYTKVMRENRSEKPTLGIFLDVNYILGHNN